MVGGGRNGHASEIGHPAVAAGDIVFGKIEGGEDEHPKGRNNWNHGDSPCRWDGWLVAGGGGWLLLFGGLEHLCVLWVYVSV